MKARWRNLSEDRLTTCRREINSTDLIFEILLRLPAKSIATCRCVSKLWASIIRGPDFTDLFLTRSCDRPQVLFAFENYNHGKLFFFSSPQLQNPDVNLSPAAANYHMKIPYVRSGDVYGRVTHVHGLVCVTEKRTVKGNREAVCMVLNPSTGEYLALPKVKTKNCIAVIKTSLGYDPIDKKIKVLLSMTTEEGNRQDTGFAEHQILTLGTGTWRPIECCTPHYSPYETICINGVVYYQAIRMPSKKYTDMIICFDVRSEKFSVKTMKMYSLRSIYCGTLTNYNGKLGILFSEGDSSGFGSSRSVELWVVEDLEKQEWSKHRFVLPALWKKQVGKAYLRFVGVTRTNEIVMSTDYLTSPFYVFYYNIERKTVVRVEVQGMEKFTKYKFHIFLNHVEDVKLMGVV